MGKTSDPKKIHRHPRGFTSFERPRPDTTPQSSAEYKAVRDDKTIQTLLTDEEIMRDIQDKNFAKLLTNPKMQALMKDPELVRKILDMNVKIMEQKTRPDEDQK